VAPYTVARVYRLLEQDGILETRGRNGTVVSAPDSAQATLQLAASQYAQRARELGIPADEALSFVRTALDR
jgi:DNA-binding transcriptional regulator YhcF (GntR family)